MITNFPKYFENFGHESYVFFIIDYCHFETEDDAGWNFDGWLPTIGWHTQFFQKYHFKFCHQRRRCWFHAGWDGKIRPWFMNELVWPQLWSWKKLNWYDVDFLPIFSCGDIILLMQCYLLVYFRLKLNVHLSSFKLHNFWYTKMHSIVSKSDKRQSHV